MSELIILDILDINISIWSEYYSRVITNGSY